MEKVHEDILTALGLLQFQDVARQQVEHVQTVLDQLAAHFAAVTEALREKHVMHAQRVTHDAVLGRATKADDRPTIELF